MTKKTNQQWGGRFSESMNGFILDFNESVSFDQRMAMDDINGSIAHSTMLGEQGILSKQDVADIHNGLNQIRKEIINGEFEWSAELEDVHMNIEARLTDLIGIAGKRLHTGRSRNDQVATDIRLHLRDTIDYLRQQLSELMHGIVELADKEAATIMPGFTHLQSAQPVTFGHHLLAWFEMLKRDDERLVDCRKRLNQSPLGAAALAGTTYPINRNRSAELLGFDKPCANSLDAVSDRDFAIELCSVNSMVAMHLSRMAEELIIWNSVQFQFVDLPDRFCTGSSIMPQKKNPDIAELVRGKTGRVYGSLMTMLTLMKSQPLAYNKDNQEDKEPLFDSIDTITACVRAFAGMIPHIEANHAVMHKTAKDGFATATDLADYLVKKGVAFRDAHEIVGKTVATAIEKKCSLDELSLEDLQAHCDIIEQSVFDILTVEGSVNARDHLGGTAPRQVKIAATDAKAFLNTLKASHQ
ncbi:MAG: argininosuccinate lyase [Gammaproteobacteria bacterium]|nr:argininosuccinate lyase [Gammaproteobacteria bacterium]